MTHKECDAVVVTCSDYRFIQPLQEFLSAEELSGACDVVAWPGGGAALLDPDRKSIEDALGFLIELHAPSSLLLVVHEDCSRVKGFKTFDSKDEEIQAIEEILGSASEIAASLFPSLRRRAIRLTRGGAQDV